MIKEAFRSFARLKICNCCLHFTIYMFVFLFILLKDTRRVGIRKKKINIDNEIYHKML